MNHKRFILAAIALCIVTLGAFWAFSAQQSVVARDKALNGLVKRADIIAALKRANLRDHSLCKSIDKIWIAEYKNPTPNGVIAQLKSTPMSIRLARDVELSRGYIEQIMLFDKAGCLVATDHPTHDYDQSDEDKWKRTVGAGSTKLIFEGRDHDPKGNTDQVSRAVVDSQGKIIGGMTLRWCHTSGGCL